MFNTSVSVIILTGTEKAKLAMYLKVGGRLADTDSWMDYTVN